MDKIKAIRFHYYRQKSPGNGNELSSSEEEGEESDTESDTESDDENSEDDLVIADLDEQSTVRMPVLTFVPDDQIAKVTVQAHIYKKKKRNTKRKQTNKRTKTKTKKVSKATKADLLHYGSKWKDEQEQWLILALPNGRITAKYDILIGTSWTAKKVTLQFSSTGDC